MAGATRLRTQRQHRRRVLLALTLGSPVGAGGLLVGAYGGAHAARLWAVAHDSTRVVRAFGLTPDSALRRVLILARGRLANLARARAGLQREAWILVALPGDSPAGAIVVRVFALITADAAGDRAMLEHEVRILSTRTG